MESSCQCDGTFSCAMQVQAFRKVNGYAFASTMCIGNLRSCVESLCAYGRTRDKHILQKAFSYLGIIILFAVGAALGGHFIPVIAARTIWISCGLLIGKLSVHVYQGRSGRTSGTFGRREGNQRKLS